VPLIVVLDPGSADARNVVLGPFKESLASLGWIDGQSIRLQVRYADNRPDRMLDQAREAVAQKPAIIYTHGSVAMVSQVASATSTIPIVVGVAGDFVGMGLAKTLARPGGNVTGMTMFGAEPDAKRLEILKEAVPTVRKVGVVGGLAAVTAAGRQYDATLANSARALGLTFQIVRAATPGDIPAAIAELKRGGAHALLALDGPMIAQSVPEVAALALAQHLPSISQSPGFAEAGGLLQSGADVIEIFRKSARLVDKVLRGANPGELPIEQPTTFALIVNLRTASALGLKMPLSVLARADRIIE
jgi:putative ABC transport system substrate-binding protein